jgi:hypothetical protein
MQRVWATVVSVWAVLAIVAALAWARAPVAQPLSQPTAMTLLVKGKNGTTQRVHVVGAASGTTPHATTQTSPPPGA